MRRRFAFAWFVVAVLAIQLGVLALGLALAAQLAAVANALAGVATVVLAALTVLVLAYNARVLDATRDSATATREEAEATREEARATREQTEATKRQADIAHESLEELRQSRELDARPLIVRQENGARRVGGRSARDVVVTNIGRGPALNCIYLRESAGIGREVVLTDGFNLAAGHFVEIRAEQAEHLDSASNLFASSGLPREALFCQDQFGNAFRYTPGLPKPDVVDRRNLDKSTDGRPLQWTTVYLTLLAHRKPEPEPEPGPYFLQGMHIGSFSQCQTTVVWEGVPATDLAMSDFEVDMIEQSVRSIEPRSRRESAEVARWAFPPGGSIDEEWRAAANAGPCVSMTKILALQSKPSPSGQGTVADLPLVDLTSWWQVASISSRRLASALSVHRIRLGLTLSMYGNPDKPRLQDVDFGPLEKPRQSAQPGYYVQHFSAASEPFEVDEWPQRFLENAAREVIRRFGYRDLDGVVASLPFRRPQSDPPQRVEQAESGAL